MFLIGNWQVVGVRLPTDSGRAKGFGYAEFADQQSLLDALALNEAVRSSSLLLILLSIQL